MNLHAGERNIMQGRIYLDFNASTPLAPEVASAMEQVLREPFGNPSSEHWAGRPARNAVEKARVQISEAATRRKLCSPAAAANPITMLSKVFSSPTEKPGLTSLPLRLSIPPFSALAVFSNAWGLRLRTCPWMALDELTLMTCDGPLGPIPCLFP